MGDSLLKRLIDALNGTKFVQTKLGGFFYGILTELDAVTWPTKDEVRNSTVVVLIAVAFFALYSGLWEMVMSYVQKFLYSA